MNNSYTITITSTINGWLVEKRTLCSGRLHQFVYITLARMMDELPSVICHDTGPTAEGGDAQCPTTHPTTPL